MLVKLAVGIWYLSVLSAVESDREPGWKVYYKYLQEAYVALLNTNKWSNHLLLWYHLHDDLTLSRIKTKTNGKM